MGRKPDLVEAGATRPRVAAWDHPLDAPNLEDARISHRLAPLAGMPGVGGVVEALVRQRFRLKSWQYMTAVTDELFIAFAAGTAGFASNGFVYAAELSGGAGEPGSRTRGGRVHEKFALTPLMVGTRLAPSSTSGSHRFAARGLSVSIENRGRAFDARVNATTESGSRLAAELSFDSEPSDQHLSICVPLPGRRWNYTHKFAAFSVSGHVTVDDRRIELPRGRSFGTMDFTKMYALRHAVWRWIALCGRTRGGKVVGLNLVDPTPEAPISENALWIDGVRRPLANVSIDPRGARADGVSISMRDLAEVSQRLDVPLVRHRLRHVVGAFAGTVVDVTGQTHELEELVGIYEDYDTWW
jgi:hypothetical protein